MYSHKLHAILLIKKISSLLGKSQHLPDLPDMEVDTVSGHITGSQWGFIMSRRHRALVQSTRVICFRQNPVFNKLLTMLQKSCYELTIFEKASAM